MSLLARAVALMLIGTLGLVGCGSGGGSSAAPFKDLFSIWTETTSGQLLDMSAGSFGAGQSFSAAMPGGEICDCTLTIIGTQASGSGVLSSCTYRAATGGGSDLGCASLNSTSNYTNNAAVLKICDAASPTSCQTYR